MVEPGKHGPLIGAVDQGTSSTRFLVFAAETAELITYHQEELELNYPHEGWVDIDPMLILDSVWNCINQTIENLKRLDISPGDIKALGITNQRETTVVWDKLTGKPLYNALVWLDLRTSNTVKNLIDQTGTRDKDYLRHLCGLPFSTYFSAVKLRWLIDNEPGVANAIKEDRALFGTVDTWLLWNLTGGVNSGVHKTDVTNASRTMLMNLETVNWDPVLCKYFKIPMNMLPEIRSSAEVYGTVSGGLLDGVPIASLLGDQQAAVVGHLCFKEGQAKNTYGTGCFMLYNTGKKIIQSKLGLLTTVAYQLGKDAPVIYALEGSIAVAGGVVRWLRDNLGIISSSSEVETLASSVDDNGGVYFVPAFSGLYTPYWDIDARGTICGLTQYSTKAHIARAALEAVCFQTREILDVMNKESGIPMHRLKVDGGMTVNNLLMKMQANLLGIPVVRPTMAENTALGAAMAAGHAVGIWKIDRISTDSMANDTFEPTLTDQERELLMEKWEKAVERSMKWESAEKKAPIPDGRARASQTSIWNEFLQFCGCAAKFDTEKAADPQKSADIHKDTNSEISDNAKNNTG